MAITHGSEEEASGLETPILMTIITSNERIWMAEMSLCLVGQSLSHGDLEGNFCLECVQRWEGGLRGLTSFFAR